MLDKAEAT